MTLSSGGFEAYNKVKSVHLNSVKAGLVRRPEDGPGSSVHDYTSSVNSALTAPSGFSVDRVVLPADGGTRT
jgi:hypothetical protein